MEPGILLNTSSFHHNSLQCHEIDMIDNKTHCSTTRFTLPHMDDNIVVIEGTTNQSELVGKPGAGKSSDK